MAYHEDLLTTALNAGMVAGLALLFWVFARSAYNWKLYGTGTKPYCRERDGLHYFRYLVFCCAWMFFAAWYLSILIFGGPILVKWDISF